MRKTKSKIKDLVHYRNFTRLWGELASAALRQGDLVIGTTRNGHSELGVLADRLRVFALDVTHSEDVVSAMTKAWRIHGRIERWRA